METFKDCATEKLYAIQRYDEEFKIELDNITRIFAEKVFSLNSWDTNEQNRLKILVQVAETLAMMINTPLMFDDDELTRKLHNQREECRRLYDDINMKFGT